LSENSFKGAKSCITLKELNELIANILVEQFTKEATI
jgi:hypothetical protein